MKSTQIKRTKVSDWTVSTVFIEPFAYYETAVRDDTDRDPKWEPREWAYNEAAAISQHDGTVEVLGR